MRIVEKHSRSLEAWIGQRNCWRIPFIHQGLIKKLVVAQVGGAQQNYHVTVFNSYKPCMGTSASSGGAEGTDPQGSYSADPELYKVMPSFDGSAGTPLSFISENGYAFRNMDGDRSNPQYYIYVEIALTVVGDDSVPPTTGSDANKTTWDVAITAQVDEISGN